MKNILFYIVIFSFMNCNSLKKEIIQENVYIVLKNEIIEDNMVLKFEIINTTNNNYYFPLDLYYKYHNNNFPNVEIVTKDNQQINIYSIDPNGQFPKKPFRENKEWLSNEKDFVLVEKNSRKEINFDFSYSEDLSMDYAPSLFFYDFDMDYYDKKINTELKGRIQYTIDSLQVINWSKDFKVLNTFKSKGYKCFNGTIYSNWIPVKPKKEVKDELLRKFEKHFED